MSSPPSKTTNAGKSQRPISTDFSGDTPDSGLFLGRSIKRGPNADKPEEVKVMFEQQDLTNSDRKPIVRKPTPLGLSTKSIAHPDAPEDEKKEQQNNPAKVAFALDLSHIVEKNSKPPHSPETPPKEKSRSQTSAPNLYPRPLSPVITPSVFLPNEVDQRDFLSKYYRLESETFQLANLTYVSSSKSESFDEGLVKYALKAIKGMREEISPKIIEQLVIDLCRTKIDDLFRGEKIIPSAELQLSEARRSKLLLRIIQYSGIILLPALKRILFIKRAVEEYLTNQSLKSAWSEKLYGVLLQLATPDTFSGSEYEAGLERGKSLPLFLSTFQTLLRKGGDKKIAEIIAKALGEKEKLRTQVMATLEKWNDPPKELKDDLQKQVHTMSWDNVSAMTVPFHVHHWLEGKEPPSPIGKITMTEVVRCLGTDNCVPMNLIKINGKVFHSLEQSTKEYSQELHFENLLSEVYQAGFDPSMSLVSIKSQVETLLASGTSKKGSLDSSSGPEITWMEVIGSNRKEETPVPCLDLLRLCANSAWGHCDFYFRQLFPGLFEKPYWAKLLPGIECVITIKNSEDYSVKLSRKYGVYPLQNPDVKESLAIDNNRLLAVISVDWTLNPTKEGIQGILNISREVEIQNCARNFEKWHVLNSIINFTDLENPSFPESPHTPKMSSSMQRLSHSSDDTIPMRRNSQPIPLERKEEGENKKDLNQTKSDEH